MYFVYNKVKLNYIKILNLQNSTTFILEDIFQSIWKVVVIFLNRWCAELLAAGDGAYWPECLLY